MNNERYAHCGYCGSKFLEQVEWPRKCFICYNDSYRNPIPIITCMIQVARWLPFGVPEYGLLIHTRWIEPEKDGLALVGGYIDLGETWQQAAARETKEEVNIDKPESNYVFWDIKNSNNGNMIIFCYSKYIITDFEKFNASFIPNKEVQRLDVYWGIKDNKKLCFPTHKACADAYLDSLKWF